VADFVVEDDDSNFLIGTLYNAPGGNDSLVNGAYSVSLGNTGTVTLPSGGTISEGVVTSNPTIQLTPATPEVASQKLVIKGGGGQYYITENGIGVGTNNIIWEVSDSATFYVYAPTRPDETLYWWIVPEESGISTTMSGTVELNGNGDGIFNFTVISDAYEFRVRVSPTEDTYDPESIGVESVLINGDAPAYGDYHLHLTTGDLTETSIFLGTDDHNVRTTTDGKIQITTFVNSYTVNNVWEFDTDGALTLPNGGHIGPSGGKGAGTTYGAANDHLVSLTSYYNSGLYSSCVTAYADGTLNITAYNDGGPNPAKIWTFANDGSLTLPGDILSENAINIDINLSDSTLRRWTFGEDGDLKFPDATTQTTAFTGNAATIDITDTNGIDTNYYLTFVENRDGGEILRADIDLIFNSADNTLTAGNITTGVLKIDDGVHEKFQTKADATGTVTHDCASGHIFYHTSPDANWTANFTNLNLSTGYVTAVSLIIVQGATGYYPTVVQIGGVSQTINWQGNTNPTPSSSRTDVVTFSIINEVSGYTVLGQLTGF
jgi:hypothetical protein